MKGIVFTEFLEMVEDKFGFDVADKIVTEADLPSGGVYTGVGTYDHGEMVSLVVNLGKETNTEIPALLNVFGNHLFGQFTKGYKQFFNDVPDALSFLERIENYIHVEVLKLYPGAELPRFDIERVSPNKLVMHYTSDRKMGDLAEGLIQGAVSYFNEDITIVREDVTDDGGDVIFTLSRNA
ncbi:MAG: heme NO-binding domain-containing protein [Bacteroidota bacterium]